MSNDIKMRIIQVITSTGKLNPGVFDISDENKVRFAIEQCNAGNIIVIRGRIKGQTNFVNLKTITGLASEVANVSTYDEIEIECTTFDPQVNVVKVIASSFNEAGGSTDIDVPSGDNLTEVELLTFTSSDSSVTITGNDITKTIDLKVSASFGGAYVDSFSTGDWTGPVLGVYSLSYLQAIHLKGVNPTIDIYESIASVYSPLEVSTEIDVSGNIVLQVSQIPNLRFNGLIIIK